ncbi:MAG: beta-galactosidase trimerization domain-containing protein [Proteobacteria bacterium]|nr:beta-galactosidase trimerization domain-containing protein [Burkholderiales bacterium]
MERETMLWWKRPNRVLLINLREGDEPRIDAEALVADAKRFSATAFCISGGGIVAFYQTRIAEQRISSALGNRDLLAEIVPVAHREGLKVLARIDPSCAPKALADVHPEWFSRDLDGQLCEVSDHYVTCPSAAYYRERLPEVVTEILREYAVDGIWNNAGKFGAWDTTVCHCDACQASFGAETGARIPVAENWSDPNWRAFNQWRYRQIASWVRLMHEAIHRANPAAIFISAVQLMESLETIQIGGWDIDYWLDAQDVLTFECQRRNTVPWWPGLQAKYLAGLGPERPRWMTASYFYPWWRLSATPEAENRAWIAQQFANGVSSWLHINGGYSPLFDRRMLSPMREVYARLASWEQYFEAARSVAAVAIVFSRFSQDNYGRDTPDARYFDSVRGAYCALQEAHIPFDVLSDKFLDAATLGRYGAVVLPNAACLTQACVEALTAYVRGGGALVLTFETGRYDEHGDRAARPTLDALIGAQRNGIRHDLKSSYAKLERRDDPLLADLGDTDLIPNDGALVELDLDDAVTREVPLTLIPPVIAHSGATISIPEYSAIGSGTDIPVVLRGQHGAGRVVYFANQIDALFHRYGFPDLGRVFANAVAWAAGESRVLVVDAPDHVDITHMRQEVNGHRRDLVHLINFPVGKHVNSGWRHPGTRIRPVDDIVIRLRCDSGSVPSEVRTASTETQLAFTLRAGWVEVVVSRLDDHEIVVFDFASTNKN